MTLVWVMLGGALGTAARFFVVTAAARIVGGGFPWGTLAVNVVGSFLMGVIMATAAARGMQEDLRLALTTGFLGGFTTYSAFAYEAVSTQSFAYVAATLIAGLGACWLGLRV